jgi:hypothetical protein
MVAIVLQSGQLVVGVGLAPTPADCYSAGN